MFKVPSLFLENVNKKQPSFLAKPLTASFFSMEIKHHIDGNAVTVLSEAARNARFMPRATKNRLLFSKNRCQIPQNVVY
jgi:hypothetical protein